MRTLKAWLVLISLGKVRELRKEVDTFYRGNIIRVLKEEGWFKYLSEPRSLEDIASQFNYTDTELLQEILDVLLADQTLLEDGQQKYSVNEPLNEEWVAPRLFNESLQGASIADAEFLPKRLRTGDYLPFAEGGKLFDWENAFLNDLYFTIREAAFKFAGEPKEACQFLNIGCGAGYETAHVWWKYFQKGLVNDRMKITAVDPDSSFIKIAKAEFPRMLEHVSGFRKWSPRTLKKYEQKFTGQLESKNITDSGVFFKIFEDYFPTFETGDVIDLNFEDESFDVVFLSQVFHWTNTDLAVKELLRVTKKGGIIFGSNNFFPNADPYSNLHLKVIEGASGYIHREDFKKLAGKHGASQVDLATPISVFVIKK